MKVNNEVIDEIKKIRNALDNMYDIFKFDIKSLETYEKNLVVCKTN